LRQLTALGIICQAGAVEDHTAADDRGEETAFAFGYAACALVRFIAKDYVVGIRDVKILACPPAVGERVEHVFGRLVAADVAFGIAG
jgi:hypothetical protein